MHLLLCSETEYNTECLILSFAQFIILCPQPNLSCVYFPPPLPNLNILNLFNPPQLPGTHRGGCRDLPKTGHDAHTNTPEIAPPGLICQAWKTLFFFFLKSQTISRLFGWCVWWKKTFWREYLGWYIRLTHEALQTRCSQLHQPSWMGQFNRTCEIPIICMHSRHQDSLLPRLTTPLSKNSYSSLGFHLEVAKSS